MVVASVSKRLQNAMDIRIARMVQTKSAAVCVRIFFLSCIDEFVRILSCLVSVVIYGFYTLNTEYQSRDKGVIWKKMSQLFKR